MKDPNPVAASDKTLRAEIATKVMAAIISNPNVKTDLTNETTAKLAVALADALIAELSE